MRKHYNKLNLICITEYYLLPHMTTKMLGISTLPGFLKPVFTI